MALRTGHGNGRGQPRIEVVPADELPAGVPGERRPPVRVKRTGDGRVMAGEAARELGRRGGIVAAENRRMAKLLGLRRLPEGHEYQPYAAMAREWREEQLEHLAQLVGGGVISPGVAAIVSEAALKVGASRWLYDFGSERGEPKALLEASRLGDSCRQALLAAHELCAKEAQIRELRQRRKVDQVSSLASALMAQGEEV